MSDPSTPVATPATEARRVAIITLGCGRNEVDSDQLAGLFHRDGATVVDDPQTADVVLVNTCTFIAPAKQESVDTVLEACQLKEDGDARAVVVVGCMAQRYPQDLADAIPEADAIVGFDGYGRLPAIIEDVLSGRVTDRVIGVGAAHPGSRPLGRDLPLMVAPSTAASTVAQEPRVDREPTVLGLTVQENPAAGHSGTATAPTSDGPTGALAGQDDLDRMPASGPRFPVRAHDGRPWAYLKIASGCDRVCTFCAIPSFRGRFRSRPLDEIVAEATWLADQGARELVLVSENTTSWGKDLDGGRALQPALLRELSGVDGIERLRLMYLQPAELTMPLLEAMAAEPKVASYFDLSLQHVSGPVVARMARSGDHERFGELITRIRELDPDAVFRSNFILGFPGETEHDVEVLQEFLTEHRLDWVGLFAFSREDGTPSDHLPDQVPAELAAERVRRVSELQEQIADEAARRFIGRQLEVTVQEHLTEAGAATTIARSYREAPDTDGEVQLIVPPRSAGRAVPKPQAGDLGSVAADLPVGRTVTATVTDAVGVDLVATVEAASA
ncbi:MAG: 30S ribosomal protein S12 methylthiotransferase RimO [Nitriliruptor sp.]|nr:MAG: 30S ribosomal protein S12 methylthiotransferase RimO [Nitriliruptor sp.]